MAEASAKKSGKSAAKKSLIDPIYQKFTKGVLRAIGSTEFYEFFMDAISRAENQFQFSNRKLVKTIDLTWVDAIEDTLNAMQNIVNSPRNVIKEEELIVNVANARKAGSETVRHLAQHSDLVENFDEGRGEVRPGRLMQRYREDSIGLYENRLVFTTMEMAFQFVKIRYDALLEAMSDEFGAKLKVNSDMTSATEKLHLDMFLHIKEIEGALETDDKNADVFNRISRMYRVLSVLMNSQFSEQLGKLQRVRGKITKTNVLKKNKNYKKITALYDFMRNYDEVGYTIRIVEQNPVITEEFQRDIFHNILFNYLILKGYLEDAEDRQIPTAGKNRKRTLRPKFIKEIVEELTEDYDLPEVEIRKVLIEELTKEQLMREEAAERRRLVEEQQQRKREEQERQRAEKKAEQERLKAERAAERERIRMEKEAEEQRLKAERMERAMEDRRRCRIFKKELEYFTEHLDERMLLRERQQEKQAQIAEKQDYADAVALLEEAEQRKREAEERKRKRRQEERERIRLEKQMELERIEREKREAEEKLRLEEEERMRKQQEEERLAAEAQRQKDLEALQIYVAEFTFFEGNLEIRRKERTDYLRELAQEQLQREEERRLRRARKGAVG